MENKMNLKILGGGCRKCETLLANTKAAVQELSLAADVEYITDMSKVTAYGVMSLPALVKNETVISSGRVLSAKEIEKLIKD